MLSWSATETAQTIDLAPLVDDAAELDLTSGPELIALGRAVTATRPDPRRHHRQQHQWIIDVLGLDRFPHAPS